MLLFLISIAVIALTALCLVRHLNAQGTLMTAGVFMCVIGLLCGGDGLGLAKPTGSVVFDVVRLIEETFTTTLARAGLMIMTIGGYVAFMNKIEATNALVRIASRPLRCFRRFPMVAAALTIPIGQLLFVTIPSATGIGLLLVASVYPILTSLGVSRLTALSMIAATTVFGQGPGSANTALAAELIGENYVQYFITHQLPLVMPTTVVVMLSFCAFNAYFDRMDRKAGKAATGTDVDEMRTLAPRYFALFPILPLVLLIVFSPYVGLVPRPIHITTTTAMFFSLFVVLVFCLLHSRSLRVTFQAFGAFWQGMGKVFGNVVTLIVASEIFSKGLIRLDFIGNLITLSSGVGLGGIAIIVVFTLIIFCAAILMGSGNAAFFSFGPLMPGIASRLGVPAYALVLPTQLASSMGRAASPIAGVIVAMAGLAGVSPMELARRNAAPLAISVAFLVIYHIMML